MNEARLNVLQDQMRELIAEVRRWAPRADRSPGDNGRDLVFEVAKQFKAIGVQPNDYERLIAHLRDDLAAL